MTGEHMELLLSGLSSGFFIRQVLTILALYIIGICIIYSSCEKMEKLWAYLLAFPIGIAVFCITGFFLLVMGITYSALNISIAIVIEFIIIKFVIRKGTVFDKTDDNATIRVGRLIFVLMTTFLVACIATSGFFSLSASNDTMYYYMYYPEIIVENGKYLASYDVFLTDVGPMTAMIGSLPSLFGFDQIYGIHQFFNINFLGIFALAIYEQACKHVHKKYAIAAALISTIMLLTSTPYLVLTKWVIANTYVMYYSFILMYLAYRYNPFNKEEEDSSGSYLFVMGLLIGVISMLRMEGIIIACFIIICMSTLRYRNTELIIALMVPTMLLPILYYIRCFFVLQVAPLYSFLTWQKALLAVIMMFVLFLYLLLIRGKVFLKLQERMRLLIILMLLIGNGVLYFVSPSNYQIVIKAFYDNIADRQGWGYTISIMAVYYVVIYGMTFLFRISRRRFVDIRYDELVLLGYIFLTVAVSFARGGGLRYGIGDSGNRVMLQVIPFAFYTLICRAVELFGGLKTEKEEQGEGSR